MSFQLLNVDGSPYKSLQSSSDGSAEEQLKTQVIELPVSTSNFQSLRRKKEFSYFYGLGGRFNLVLVHFLC